MRGNRQGNNAFVEDSVHQYQTPQEYLLESKYCLRYIFSNDTVEKETFEVIKNGISEANFNKFVEKVVPILLEHGSY